MTPLSRRWLCNGSRYFLVSLALLVKCATVTEGHGLYVWFLFFLAAALHINFYLVIIHEFS